MSGSCGEKSHPHEPAGGSISPVKLPLPTRNSPFLHRNKINPVDMSSVSKLVIIYPVKQLKHTGPMKKISIKYKAISFSITTNKNFYFRPIITILKLQSYCTGMQRSLHSCMKNKKANDHRSTQPSPTYVLCPGEPDGK